MVVIWSHLYSSQVFSGVASFMDHRQMSAFERYRGEVPARLYSLQPGNGTLRHKRANVLAWEVTAWRPSSSASRQKWASCIRAPSTVQNGSWRERLPE